MNRSVQWTPGMTLEDMELQVIEVAHAFYKTNKTQTAQALGISVRNLDLKLEAIKNEKDTAETLLKERDKRDQEFIRRARGLPPLEPEPTIVPQIAPKQPVPLSQSEEIQELLPSKHSGTQHRKQAR